MGVIPTALQKKAARYAGTALATVDTVSATVTSLVEGIAVVQSMPY